MGENNTYIGKQIGNYRIDQQIASGGFGGVYLAQHLLLKERFVAIKMLHAVHLGSQEEREGFLQEAQWLERLRHPHILSLYDVGIYEGTPYLIAEYAQNGSLRDKLRRRGSQPLPVNEAINILSQVGQALQHAHQQNVIHRDLKPENILFNARDDVLLADFGISTVLTTSSIKVTHVSGTPSYMAPEQFRGIASRESDQYALGCIAYELFTGQRPFGAADFIAMGFKHTTENPPAPSALNPQLPRQIEQAVLKAMAKERSARYPDIAAFITALKDAVYSTDIADQAIYREPLPDEPTLLVAPSRPVSTASANPLTPPPAVPSLLVTPPHSTGSDPSITPPEQISEPSILPPAQSPSISRAPEALSPTAPTSRRRPKGLLIALIALLIIVLVGSGTFFVFSSRNQPPNQSPPQTVGHGFFTSSGLASGQNNQGINDMFQINLSNIPNPPSGKSYYVWLLPDINQETNSVSLGSLDISNGRASLHASYVDPQHTNLIAQFSRLLITEEDTSPPPQSYSLDKKMWRYYAEIPQTPASKDCLSQINQLSDLCHLRHILSGDPELNRVNLPGGLSYWFVNNAEEVQKWAREAVDHTAAADVRHKIVNMLYILDGLVCVQQDLRQASSAPGTNNTPDDNTLNRIAAVSLLDCPSTPTAPGYLIHIHNHLSAITQSPGVLTDQVTLATQISTELNTMKVWLGQVQADALQLVRLDNTQLTQANGLALRHEIDTLTTNVLSGGTDPNTGAAVPGIVQISNQMQQLATFDVMQYTA